MSVSGVAAAKPLTGVRVLELGQLIAGPFASSLLGYYGAEVIKIEDPKLGDPIRSWRGVADDGTSVWWRSIGRNKKSITLDLRIPKAQQIVRDLSKSCDVIIENFKPGTMEKWGLSPEQLQKENPGLIFTRVSGYGQTGPMASKPGFASVCEAFGGLRHVTGFKGEAPVRSNISIGDSLAGLHAAFGITLALLARANKKNPSHHIGRGQVVDVAIYESVFNMMEAIVPEYTQLGMVREPSGTTVTGIVPTNAYRCSDGTYIIIGANGDSLFQRLMSAISRQDLANDPELKSNAGRVKHAERIDSAIEEWTSKQPPTTVLATMETSKIPAGQILSVAEITSNPQYRARNMFEKITLGTTGKTMEIHAITPKLLSTPGSTVTGGPELGQHTAEVLSEVLGMSEEEIDELRQKGVI